MRSKQSCLLTLVCTLCLSGMSCIQKHTAPAYPSIRTAHSKSGITTYTIGQGPMLLVLGGGPGVSSQLYQHHLRPLAKERTLVFFDYRGTGRSRGGPPSSFKNDHLDLLEVISQLATEKVGILAHSYGGIHALKYAAAHPHRVTDLILISTATAFSQVGKDARMAKAKRLGESKMAEQAALFGALFQAPDNVAIAQKVSRIEAYNQFLSPTTQQISLFVGAGINYKVAMENQDWVGLDFTSLLSQIKARTLVVFSTKDIIVAPKYSRALARGIPHAKRLELSRSGHWCFIEEPEAFFSTVGRFLSSL